MTGSSALPVVVGPDCRLARYGLAHFIMPLAIDPTRKGIDGEGPPNGWKLHSPGGPASAIDQHPSELRFEVAIDPPRLDKGD